MKESIHGHEVIGMMTESGNVYTTASLKEAMVERFGGDARFHTCSANNLTPEGLIEFFEARGKLSHVEGGFIFGAAPACGDEAHS